MRILRKIGEHLVACLVIAALVVAGVYLVVTSAAKPAKEAIATLTTDTITQEWKSTAPVMNKGTVRLEVVTSKSEYVFSRKSEWQPFWIPFPDVVVKASAPVEVTYYVDLNGQWDLQKNGDTVRVVAPPLKFNTPAIDTGKLREWVEDGSVFRRQSVVQDDLRHSLTQMATQIAQENTPSARTAARDSIRHFVENWLADRYSDGKDKHVEVVFADEEDAH